MRDAFGSTFMIKLIIIFIVAYVSFMTIAVSYAKVFRMKNYVINILEQQQFDGTDAEWNSKIKGEIDAVLDDFAYRFGDSTTINNDCKKQGEKLNLDARLSDNGACVITKKVNGDSIYHTIIVYLVVDFPFFDYDAVIPIYGETEVISQLRKI